MEELKENSYETLADQLLELSCFEEARLDDPAFSAYKNRIFEMTKACLGAAASHANADEINALDAIWKQAEMEESYQRVCRKNYPLSNIFAAVCGIFKAQEDGRPYGDIDTYETACGKTIQRVLAEKSCGEPVFYDLNDPSSKARSGFDRNLYFVFDGGVLVVTESLELWCDGSRPSAETIDVSSAFSDVIGAAVSDFRFDCHEVQKGFWSGAQPIVTLKMNNGSRLTFSTNFGEVPDGAETAYFFIA